MNPKYGVFLLAILLLASNRLSNGGDAEWGHLSGRFLYDGDPPPAKSLPVPAFKLQKIGGKEVPDESLVVDEDGALANVFIWLCPAIGVKPPVHPSYDDAEESKVELVARHYRLQPHALFVRTGQELTVRLADENVGYNLNFQTFSNSPYCNLIPAGGSVDLEFGSPERVPIDITCSIHPWIHGRMLVTDHPYVAITDSKGRFEIRNLPVGEWNFVALHERAGYIKQPTIDGRQLEWKRGTFQHTIAPGENALGDILVAPEAFQRK